MELNKPNLKKILAIISFTILLYWGLQSLESLLGFLKIILGLMAPFLIGGCIAFILNVPMRSLECRLFPDKPGKKQRKGLHRGISLVLTILLVIGLLLVGVFLIIPEISNSFQLLSKSVPGFLQNLQNFIENLSKKMPEMAVWLETLDMNWKGLNWSEIGKTMFSFLGRGAGSLLNSSFNIAASIFSGIVTTFLAIVFAIYILVGKEKLIGQSKQIFYAYLPETSADRILAIGRLTNKTFSSFFSGQCVESVILGTMFFIAMSLLGFPYSLMISVLIAFTALIPIFGAFIGCAIGAFLILMVNPMQALYFLILFLILQQIEGNFIYPKVVGSSVGLPPMWVLVAVSVGASTMGVLGMLINIPLFSVIYSLLRESTRHLLKEKKISPKKLL